STTCSHALPQLDELRGIIVRVGFSHRPHPHTITPPSARGGRGTAAGRGVLGGFGMKHLSAAILGVCVVVFAGTAKAQDDNEKKLLGTWIIDKSGSDLPSGSTIEFAKDGKLNVVIKDAGGDMKFDGTYKVEKDKISVKLKVNTETLEET